MKSFRDHLSWGSYKDMNFSQRLKAASAFGCGCAAVSSTGTPEHRFSSLNQTQLYNQSNLTEIFFLVSQLEHLKQ